MEATLCSETSILTRPTRGHIPEDGLLPDSITEQNWSFEVEPPYSETISSSYQKIHAPVASSHRSDKSMAMPLACCKLEVVISLSEGRRVTDSVPLKLLLLPAVS
jgi:hypothetical protein